jgi:hypothetical protein
MVDQVASTCHISKLCPAWHQVRTDVQIVMEGLGRASCDNADAETAALAEVQRILEPHMGATWTTGNPHNRT